MSFRWRRSIVSLHPGATRGQRISQGLWASVFLAVLSVSLLLRPNPAGHGTHTQLGLPACPSVLLFARPCPGCGMTTSFAWLAHGNPVEAFRAHPFGPILFVGWGASAALAGYGAWRARRLDTSSKAFNVSMATFAMAFFLYGVSRFYAGLPSPSADKPAVARSTR